MLIVIDDSRIIVSNCFDLVDKLPAKYGDTQEFLKEVYHADMKTIPSFSISFRMNPREAI